MNNTTVRKKRSEYEEYLLSDENIYHAIYSLESYVFDYELLEPEDKILFHRLKDKFSEELISDITGQVRDRITDLLEKEDVYVKAKVFFRPKKFDENYCTSVAAINALGPSVTLKDMEGHKICNTDEELAQWLAAPYPSRDVLEQSAAKMARTFTWERCARAFLQIVEKNPGK